MSLWDTVTKTLPLTKTEHSCLFLTAWCHCDFPDCLLVVFPGISTFCSWCQTRSKELLLSLLHSDHWNLHLFAPLWTHGGEEWFKCDTNQGGHPAVTKMRCSTVTLMFNTHKHASLTDKSAALFSQVLKSNWAVSNSINIGIMGAC